MINSNHMTYNVKGTSVEHLPDFSQQHFELVGKYVGKIHSIKDTIIYHIVVEDYYELAKMEGIVRKVDCLCELDKKIKDPPEMNQMVIFRPNFKTQKLGQIIKIFKKDEFEKMLLERSKTDNEMDEVEYDLDFVVSLSSGFIN